MPRKSTEPGPMAAVAAPAARAETAPPMDHVELARLRKESVGLQEMLTKLKTTKGVEYRELESSDLDNFVTCIQNLQKRLMELALDGLTAWT